MTIAMPNRKDYITMPSGAENSSFTFFHARSTYISPCVSLVEYAWNMWKRMARNIYSHKLR